jgi:glutamate/tyrosine decarboxylase-like PLP-dependent enzyme
VPGPNDAHDRIDPADLETRLTQPQSGVLPVAVVASAGTVNTGAVDGWPPHHLSLGRRVG